MAEQTADPTTVPVSTPKQSLSDEDLVSSSNASPTLTALEAPASLEPPSELDTIEPIQADELLAVPDAQQQQAPISSHKPSVQGGSNGDTTTPPHTQSGAPVSLKRDNVLTKGTKNTQNTQIDEHAPWYGVVVDYAPQKEQAVIFPAKMVYSSPNIPYNNESWAFQRAMGYSDYIRSGFVFLNINGEKKKRNVKDNTYVFIVLEGVVEVLIHQTSYAVSAGGVFVVPRGNYYTLRNISEKEAKLFFTQTRRSESKVTVDTKVAYFLRLRAKSFDWYWHNLARYRHHFTTRRLYFLFFLLGLMIRRLPFIGSPPILNLQIVRLR